MDIIKTVLECGFRRLDVARASGMTYSCMSMKMAGYSRWLPGDEERVLKAIESLKAASLAPNEKN